MISLICGNFRGKCGEKAKIFSYFFVKTEKGINLSEQTFYISLGRFRFVWHPYLPFEAVSHLPLLGQVCQAVFTE